MRRFWGCLLLLTACGDDGVMVGDASRCATVGGATCFFVPVDAMVGHVGLATSAPNLGCGPLVAKPTDRDVMLSGRTFDYEHPNTNVPSTTMELYTTADFSGTPFVSATSDANGNYMMTIPAATPDIFFMHATSPTTIETFNSFVPIDVTEPTFSISMGVLTEEDLVTFEQIATVVPVSGTSAISIVVRDCSAAALEHVAVVLSSTSGSRSFVDGAVTIYGSAGMLPIPTVPGSRADTNDNGMSGIFNVPPGSYYLQAWGFRDAQAASRGVRNLSLVAEYPIVIRGGADYGFPLHTNK